MNLVAIYNLDQVNTISVVTANILFVLLFVFTPAITSSLITEGGIGTIGSTMIGIATSASFTFLKKINKGKLLDNLKNRSDLQNLSKKDEP
jgi:hypothetical protein